MSSIHFESTYDDSKLQAGIKRSNMTVGEWAKNAEKQGLIVERTWNRVQQAAMGYLSLRFAYQVGKDIISVRGEFQQLNIALETMLGNKAKADQMMSGIVQRALISPFTVRDIAGQTKQLMAMGVAVEDVEKTLKTLGDVAAGTSMPLSRLAINYGQVAALGKLQQREIRDFAMAGVPIVEELANMFHKNTEEIYAMVEASQIGFKDVEKAFANMAGEGGKFYNLMERQNASVTGQLSNLRDKVDLMLNSIGKANEGVIYGGIEGLGNLVEHYQDVLDVLKVLVATYGSYKAALIATVAVQKLSLLATQVREWYAMGKALGFATANHIAFNNAAKSNPYVFAIAGITALITALSIYKRRTEEIYVVGNEYNKTLTEQKEKLDELFTKIKKVEEGTTDHKKAVDDANEFLKEYNVSLTDEKGNLVDLELAYKDAITAIDQFVAKQAKANEMMEAGNLLSSDPLKVLQQSQQRYGGLGVKLNSGDIKVLQDFVKNNAALINESITYSTFEGVSNYVKGGKLEELQKALSEAITGNTTLESISKYDTSTLYDFLSKSAGQLTDYRDRIQEINDYYNPLLASQEKSSEKDEEKLNTAQLIKKTTEEIAAAQAKLDKMRAPGYVSPGNTIKKDIEDQEAILKGLQDKLELLTGIQQKYEEDRLKALREFAEKELEIRQSLEESKVDAMKDGYNKEREQARVAYEQKKADIEKQGREYLEKLNESKGLKITDQGYITTLPADIQENLNQQKKNAEIKYNKEILNINLSTVQELKGMWQGATEDFISQREKEERAVNEKYDILIKRAKELKLSQSYITDLESKRDSSLSKIMVVDWIDAFGDLDKLSTEALENMRDKLKKYITQLSNDLNKDELKELVQTFENLQSAIEERKPFSTLVESIKDYNFQVKKIAALKEQLEYYKSIKADLFVIRRIEKDIQDAEKKRDESASKASNALNEISEQGAQLVGAISEYVGMLENFGVNIGVQGDEILSGLDKIMAGLQEIDVTRPATVISGALKTQAALYSTVFGILGLGPKELDQSVFDRYKELMSVMGDVIEKQKELLDTMAGSDAVEASEAAIEIINKQIEATKNLGTEYLNSGAGMFSSSHGVKLRKELEKYSDDLRALGINFDFLGGRMTGLFDLSSEKLELIMTELPQLWADLDEYTREYLESIINSFDEIEEINNKLNEQLTALSFDSAKDSLRDFLLDADTTMADVADNFEGYMKKAIVGIIIDGSLRERIKEWYELFAKAMEDDFLSEDEKDFLRGIYDSIYSDAINERNDAYAAAGIEIPTPGGVEAAKGQFISASQESVSLLYGQITAARVDQKKILDVNEKMRENSDQSTDYLLRSMGHLATIEQNTGHNVHLKKLEGIENKLSEISSKL